MQSFRNLQVVKRQQVEEFARRLIFPISQAAVAVSEKSSLHTVSFFQHQQTLKVRIFPLCRYLEDNRIAELPRGIFDSNVKLTKL